MDCGVSIRMESLDNNVMLLQSSKLTPGESFATDVTPKSEQEEQQSPEFNQETPEPRENSSPLEPIEFRMQQLYNRRLILLKIQQCINKAEQNSDRTEKGITNDDDDDEEQCELQAIQRELEELEVKKEMEKKTEGSKPKAITGQQEKLSSYKETPCGGIYMLPPPQPDLSSVAIATAETATQTIVPVENLGKTGGVTKCPSCEAVVVTETYSSVGEAAWITCLLSFMMGCVAGCCLIPFYLKRFRNIHHRCPMCQGLIHTHQPI